MSLRQAGLRNEFQNNQGLKVRSCLKKKNKFKISVYRLSLNQRQCLKMYSEDFKLFSLASNSLFRQSL